MDSYRDPLGEGRMMVSSVQHLLCAMPTVSTLVRYSEAIGEDCPKIHIFAKTLVLYH